MGWKEGTSTSRTGRQGPVEAHVPSARPALLGIGAKPMEEEKGKDGKPLKKRGDRREEMKYMPLVKRETPTSSGRNVRLLSFSLSRSEVEC